MRDQQRSIPIVRITLESMQHSIVSAFMDHAAQLDEQVREAVQKVCTPENVQRILDEQTAKCIEAAVAEEVRSFFSYGAGRAVVKEAVVKHLERKE